MQSVKVLAHIDRPIRLLFWTLDEMVIMMLPFLMGLLLGSVVVMLGGVVLYRIYRKYKRRLSLSRVRALMYWYLPGRWRTMLPSYQRYFVG